MDATLLIAILGSGTVVATIGAIVNGVINRKRLGADVTKIATDAAGGVIERLEAENVRLNKDNDGLHGEVDELRSELALQRDQRDRDQQVQRARDRAWREVLQVHAAWDAIAIQKMNAGTPPIEMPEAPPLTPPTLPLLDDHH